MIKKPDPQVAKQLRETIYKYLHTVTWLKEGAPKDTIANQLASMMAPYLPAVIEDAKPTAGDDEMEPEPKPKPHRGRPKGR